MARKRAVNGGKVARKPRPRRKPRSKSPKTDGTWLSPRQAAVHIGTSADTIYDACAGRGLRHVKLGHRLIRIRRDWLDDWMTAQAR